MVIEMCYLNILFYQTLLRYTAVVNVSHFQKQKRISYCEGKNILIKLQVACMPFLTTIYIHTHTHSYICIESIK